jgi:hypothetical protein
VVAQPPKEDLYQALQVDPSADDDVIAEAYRRLARKYHPDLNPGGGDAERMARIHRAYAVLKDPARRAAYDRAHRAGGPRRPAAPVVVVARCFEVGQEIAVRFVQEPDGVWRAAAILPWSPDRAPRSDPASARVMEGAFDIAPTYPGCPFCGARSFLQCPGCEQLACWDGRTSRVPRRRRRPYGRCPWCRAAIELSGSSIERLTGH